MLSKSLLYYFVRDALKAYSEDFTVRDKGNPAIIELNGNSYSIHISYVHDSGNLRENEDEVRIQISRTLIRQQKIRQKEGNKAAFIGFFEGGKIFVAWDPRHVFSLRVTTGGSVYARRSQERRAEYSLAAVHKFQPQYLEEPTITISLPSNALGLYLENIECFHRLRSENSIRSMIQEHSEALAGNVCDISKGFEVRQDGGEAREHFAYTRKAFPRDPSFTRDVLAAYDHACCICHRQLALVQAAHIIPHSEPDSPNTVTNGLALCIEHHRLYDDALLLPGPDCRLVFNSERAKYLSETKRERGLDEIKKKNGKEFRVPDLPQCHPSDDYLQRGLDIRMDR